MIEDLRRKLNPEQFLAATTIQGHTADELSAIRQALAAQTNADAVYRADELQRRMQAEAAWDSTVARMRDRPVAPLEYEDVRIGRRR